MGTIGIIGLTSDREFHELVNLHTFSADYSFLYYLAGAALVIYLGYYFLEIGVQAIAPSAENRTTKKRLIALAVLLLGLFPLSFADPHVLLFFSICFVFLVALDVLTELGFFPPSVCHPFLQKGLPGRAFGRLFYPGWYTGVFFFPIIYLALAALIKFSFDRFYGTTSSSFAHAFLPRTNEYLAIFFAIVGQLLFGAIILRLFFKKKGNHFGLFIAIQLVSLVLFMVMSIYASETRSTAIFGIFFFMPVYLLPVYFENRIAHMTGGTDAARSFLILTTAIAIAYNITLAFLSIKYFKHLNQLERSAMTDEV